jgi:hypothetical protein
MKKYLLTLFCISIAVLFSQCKKEGDAGKDGNANVMIYTFGSKTSSGGSINYSLPAEVTQARLDSSVVLAYYNPSNELPEVWYSVPGIGSGGYYHVRSFWYNTSNPVFGVRIMTPAGAIYNTAVTFTKFRIVIIPASQITVLSIRPEEQYPDYHTLMDKIGCND